MDLLNLFTFILPGSLWPLSFPQWFGGQRSFFFPLPKLKREENWCREKLSQWSACCPQGPRCDPENVDTLIEQHPRVTSGHYTHTHSHVYSPTWTHIHTQTCTSHSPKAHEGCHARLECSKRSFWGPWGSLWNNWGCLRYCNSYLVFPYQTIYTGSISDTGHILSMYTNVQTSEWNLLIFSETRSEVAQACSLGLLLTQYVAADDLNSTIPVLGLQDCTTILASE